MVVPTQLIGMLELVGIVVLAGYSVLMINHRYQKKKKLMAAKA